MEELDGAFLFKLLYLDRAHVIMAFIKPFIYTEKGSASSVPASWSHVFVVLHSSAK